MRTSLGLRKGSSPCRRHDLLLKKSPRMLAMPGLVRAMVSPTQSALHPLHPTTAALHLLPQIWQTITDIILLLQSRPLHPPHQSSHLGARALLSLLGPNPEDLLTKRCFKSARPRSRSIRTKIRRRCGKDPHLQHPVRRARKSSEVAMILLLSRCWICGTARSARFGAIVSTCRSLVCFLLHRLPPVLPPHLLPHQFQACILPARRSKSTIAALQIWPLAEDSSRRRRGPSPLPVPRPRRQCSCNRLRSRSQSARFLSRKCLGRTTSPSQASVNPSAGRTVLRLVRWRAANGTA